MTRKNLRSDAALTEVLKCKAVFAVVCHFDATRPRDRVIKLCDQKTGAEIAEISLREVIRKRKPLKGIKAVLSGKRKAGKRKLK